MSKKLVSAADSGGSASYNTVFVDTSLGTHLVLIVFDNDNVSDLKEKIEKEHPLCFPHIGGVKINALKVKRKGHFYHLSDSMFVKSAFDGVKKSWFLSVDVSNYGEHGESQHFIAPDSRKTFLLSGINNNTSSNGFDLAPHSCRKSLTNFDMPYDGCKEYVKKKAPVSEQYGSVSKEFPEVSRMEIKISRDNSLKLSSADACNGGDAEMSDKYDPLNRESEIQITQTTCIKDSCEKVITDGICNKSHATMVGAPSAAKRTNKRENKNEISLNEHALKENEYSIAEHGKESLQNGIVFPEYLVDNTQREDSDHMGIVRKFVADEPRHSSSSDVHRSSDFGIQRSNNLCEGTEVLYESRMNKSTDEVTLQCSNPLGGEISQSEPTTNNRLKIEKIKGLEDPLMENKGLLGTHSNSGKKKRKRKSSNHPNQVDSKTSFPRNDDKENSSVVVVGVNQQDANGEPNASPVPGKVLHDATASPLPQIFVKEKRVDSAVELGESNLASLIGNEVFVSDSNKEILKTDTTTQHIGEKQSSKADRSSSGRKKMKKKSSNPSNQVDAVISAPGKDVKEGSSMVTAGVNQGDVYGEPDAAPVPANSLQNAAAIQLPEISVKEKHSVSVLEMGESDVYLLKENEVLVSDSNKEISKQETKSQHLGRKRKKKSSNLQNQVNPVIPPPGRDGREGSSMVTAGINQGDTNGEPEASSLPGPSLGDIDNNKMDVGDVEGTRVASARGVGVKGMKSSKNHTGADVKDQPSLVVDGLKDVSISEHEHIVSDNSLRSKTDQTDKISEAREHRMNTDTKAMLSEKYESPSQDVNIKEATVTSELSNANGVGETENSGKRKKRRKHKNLEGGTSIKLVFDDARASGRSISSADLHETFSGNYSSNEAKISESVSSQTRREEVANASVLASDNNEDTNRSKVETTEPNLQGSQKISRGAQKPLLTNKSDKLNSITERTRRSNATNHSDSSAHGVETSEAFAPTNSKPKNLKSLGHKDQKDNEASARYQHQVAAGKASGNGNGKHSTLSQSKKPLLTTPGRIFADASSGSSEEEDGVDNADSSTRTSSDNSSSPDYSDVESNGNFNSLQNGTNGLKRKDHGGRNRKKPGSPSTKSLTLDTILRSSSRYKKAKIMATQSQLEESESQPVDFVPDTQL